MCRWVDDEHHSLGHAAARGQRDALRIRSFQLHLSFAGPFDAAGLPDTLTLLYLPRVNGSVLEINEAKINPNSPAVVALHRFRRRSRSTPNPEPVVFATTDRVRAGPGVGFEVLVKEDALLKGVFRRGGGSGEWRLDCRCAMEEKALPRVSAAEVRIVDERVGEIKERVEIVARPPRRHHRRPCRLEEIPEEREVETDGCDCGKLLVIDGEDDDQDLEWEMDGWDEARRMEMDTVSWAVDLGIWAMCLGVGVLFTRASLRRRKRLFI